MTLIRKKFLNCFEILYNNKGQLVFKNRFKSLSLYIYYRFTNFKGS